MTSHCLNHKTAFSLNRSATVYVLGTRLARKIALASTRNPSEDSLFRLIQPRTAKAFARLIALNRSTRKPESLPHTSRPSKTTSRLTQLPPQSGSP